MQQYFVSANTAQIASFAAKIVVGLTVPQLASLISFFSTPKALIFFFFGDFESISSLVFDIRWFPFVRKYRSKDKHLTLGTWATVLLALTFASAVLVTDLLLFQLAARKDGYTFKHTTTKLNFSDANVQLGRGFYAYPNVLDSNSSAQAVFGNNVYASNNGGMYMNYKTSQKADFTMDGPEGLIKAEGEISGIPRCTVVHEVTSLNVRGASSPVMVKCFFDSPETKGSGIFYDSIATYGTTGQKTVSFFETKEGANYLFVEAVQRVYDYVQTFNGTSGVDVLNNKIKGFTEEGYVMENAIIQGRAINLANNTKSVMDLIKQAGNQALSNNFIFGTTAFLHSKTDLSYKYGKYPVYTKKFIIWGTFLGVDFFDGEGQGNYYSYSYDTRQYFVKDKGIRDGLIGLNVTGMIFAPQSPQFSTDRTDDEIVLATLGDPNPPLVVIDTEMIDIFPALIVIGICSVFVICANIANFVGRSKIYKGQSFDVSRETLVRALHSLTGFNAWLIPAKLEMTDHIVMTQGISTATNKYQVRLVKNLSGSDGCTSIVEESSSKTTEKNVSV